MTNPPLNLVQGSSWMTKRKPQCGTHCSGKKKKKKNEQRELQEQNIRQQCHRYWPKQQQRATCHFRFHICCMEQSIIRLPFHFHFECLSCQPSSDVMVSSDPFFNSTFNRSRPTDLTLWVEEPSITYAKCRWLVKCYTKANIIILSLPLVCSSTPWAMWTLQRGLWMTERHQGRWQNRNKERVQVNSFRLMSLEVKLPPLEWL